MSPTEAEFQQRSVRNDAYLRLLLCEQRQGAAHSGIGDGSRLYPAPSWDENPDEPAEPLALALGVPCPHNFRARAGENLLARSEVLR